MARIMRNETQREFYTMALTFVLLLALCTIVAFGIHVSGLFPLMVPHTLS